MMDSKKAEADGRMTTGIIMKELDRISQKTLPTTKSGPGSVISVQPASKPRYPWYIVFILGNELCERFAFYGMKAVLTLYFVEAFLWSESTSTLVYHVFLVLSYFTPIFGAMLADGYIGKFATIFSLSVVYVGGLSLMTLASIPQIGLHPIAGFLCGLLLVAVGTGGIKPCVVTYGGDQFVTGQERYREQFFSVFYFCINAGSLVSTLVTPILRSDIPCLGKTGCYPAAFGLPAGLLAVALVLFVLGRPFYRNVTPSGNIVGKVIMCICHALSNKIRKRRAPKAQQWLDYASDKYDADFLSDVKKVMPVLKMFLPLPIFWTLFDQKGSRWTLQANKMDGRITDSFYWKPDQVQLFNPVLILILVPVFETLILPTLDRFGIKFRLLARMVTGMFVVGGAFVIAGILQMQLDSTTPQPVASGSAELRFFNVISCPVELRLRGSAAQSAVIYDIEPYMMRQLPNVAAPLASQTLSVEISARSQDCPELPYNSWQPVNITVRNQGVHSAFVSSRRSSVRITVLDEKKEQPKKGHGLVRFVLPFQWNTDSGGGRMTLINPDANKNKPAYRYTADFNRPEAVFDENSDVADAEVVAEQGKYQVFIPDKNSDTGLTRMGTGDERLEISNGGVYVVIFRPGSGGKAWEKFAILEAIPINMFWQIPQYFVITVAEVLFSVSGVAFAYSQAPASMKAVLQAGWLMTTALGNVVTIIISGAELVEDQATEFFVFAGLIGAFALLFAVMTRYYEYVDIPSGKNEPPHTDTEMTKEEIEEGTDHL